MQNVIINTIFEMHRINDLWNFNLLLIKLPRCSRLSVEDILILGTTSNIMTSPGRTTGSGVPPRTFTLHQHFTGGPVDHPVTNTTPLLPKLTHSMLNFFPPRHVCHFNLHLKALTTYLN